MESITKKIFPIFAGNESVQTPLFYKCFLFSESCYSTGLLKKLKEKQDTSTSHIPLTFSVEESVSSTVFYLIVLMWDGWDGYVQLGAVQSSGTQLASWPSAGGNLQCAASCTAQATKANLWRSIPHRQGPSWWSHANQQVQINGESTIHRNTLLCRGPIQKTHRRSSETMDVWWVPCSWSVYGVVEDEFIQ